MPPRIDGPDLAPARAPGGLHHGQPSGLRYGPTTVSATAPPGRLHHDPAQRSPQWHRPAVSAMAP
ncbi:hypothetical protein, partial [Streptomyces tsukubensis]|uniref:hypothetical protein n=1 Tax=Streptomyces tsukubensis TaxID=83656 RepID=UPI001C4E187A